ncbi:class I SAM-dependent methyltransferase [Nocardia sp. NPDC001965]
MTQAEKVDFSTVRWGSVEWTNLVTLYLRACDSRAPHPILGDGAASEAVERINYDWPRIHRSVRPGLNQWLVALRAARLDEWSANFLRDCPDATVLHLGCGMDTRAFRLRPPSGSRWFDVDQPEVIALRRTLYDEGDGYRMIGASVTETAWSAEIPADRPVLVIAEGLLMYLREPEVRMLLQRLTDRFSGGEILFDSLSPLAPRLSKIFTKGIVTWGIGDIRELERWNPRLRFLEDAAALAGFERIPTTPLRLLYRLLCATPAGRYDVVDRFAFGADR